MVSTVIIAGYGYFIWAAIVSGASYNGALKLYGQQEAFPTLKLIVKDF